MSIEAEVDLVDRHDIELLVRDFYRQAAMDDLLGPVFAAAKVDWPSHIDTLVRFWSWQLLGEREYAGNPLRAHEAAYARTPFTDAHYERWLDLFTETLDTRFVGPNAELAKHRAAKMAAAMERLLAGHSASGDDAIEPVWSGSRRVGRSES